MAPVRHPRAGRDPGPRDGPAYGAGAALLGLAVLAAFLPALGNGFVWDDDYNITTSPPILDPAGLASIWLTPGATQQYYPLTHTTFWIEYRLWGDRPFGYHLDNLLLHAVAAILLWRVLLLLELPGAWFAAALFAVHPVQVESVAWITERKNVLSGVFVLASSLAFLSWALSSPSRREARVRLPAAALVLYAAALLAKTVVATVPVSLALVLAWKRGRPRPSRVTVLAAMLVAGAGMAWMTARFEQLHVGASGEAWSLGLVERVLLAGRAFWFYLGKLVWPADLCFVYPRWEIDAGAPGAFVFPLAAAALYVGLFFLRRRIGAGPLVAFLHFGVSLAPALGFFDVYYHLYSFVADHFQYLASIGPLALAAALIRRGVTLLSRVRGTPPRAIGFQAAVMVPVLVALAGLSWRQSLSYRDAETLWRATLERNPRAWMARYNLARLVAERGETGEALDLLEEVLRDRPEDEDAYNLAGNVLVREGKVDEAIAMYRNAIRLHPKRPTAYHNLAVALEAKGRYPDAIEVYRKALRVEPRFLPSRNNLAVALFRIGRYEEAREAVEALRRSGGRPDPKFVQMLEKRLAERHP